VTIVATQATRRYFDSMMTSVSSETIVTQFIRVLREAFEGPPGPWSYFTDKDSLAGVFGTIDRLSSVEASRRIGSSATTIAGHVQHLVSSLAISIRWVRGELVARDRDQSWTAGELDDAGWSALRASLRREYASLVTAIQSQGNWNEDAIGGAIGSIAHVAYHLGAIRQRLVIAGTESRERP
jgi:hypothetical protein